MTRSKLSQIDHNTYYSHISITDPYCVSINKINCCLSKHSVRFVGSSDASRIYCARLGYNSQRTVETKLNRVLYIVNTYNIYIGGTCHQLLVSRIRISIFDSSVIFISVSLSWKLRNHTVSDPYWLISFLFSFQFKYLLSI